MYVCMFLNKTLHCVHTENAGKKSPNTGGRYKFFITAQLDFSYHEKVVFVFHSLGGIVYMYVRMTISKHDFDRLKALQSVGL